MKRTLLTLAASLGFCLNGISAESTLDQALWPGMRPDGSVLLPNQWSLRPAGKQVSLGDFPVNIAVHPAGHHAAILHSGYGRHLVAIVDLSSLEVVCRTNIDESFYGLEFSADGKRLFCSGAGTETIHSFRFEDGRLLDHRRLALRDPKERGVPAGLALDRTGTMLFAANVWAHQVTGLELGSPTNVWRLPLTRQPFAPAESRVLPPPDADTAAATKRAEALLDEATTGDPFPYACRVDERRQRLYVSLWAEACIAVIDLKTRRVQAHWQAGDHPNEMVLNQSGKLLYVANANRNTVTVFDTDKGKPIETLHAALYAKSPPGSTPNSLALSPDERVLFVANACNNNVAVFDVSKPGKSRALGFIPVGWYPTSVRVTPDGKTLLVANGKGVISKANPQGPTPGKRRPRGTTEQYIGGLFHGTLSVISLPSKSDFETKLREHTANAYRCSPLQADPNLATHGQAGNPIPMKLGDPSPITHCIYIIKENRTYDQMLGDMPEGNGDPALCLFPEEITPNHHQLAREFVLLDNFYVEAEVSADGHEWTVGAYATDFVEKSWPMSYGHGSSGKFPYPSEGRFKIAEPPSGYIWDRAAEAGISYRSYGEFINAGKTPDHPGTSRVPSLRGHFDEWFRPWDLDYLDIKRAERFIQELKRFEAEGQMPRLQLIRLPNDHTHGTTAGKRSPRAMVADNDLAFGLIVEAVSHSKFWPTTAIFVVEDDAQNGADHVDAHRTIAYAISPYAKRGAVDSTMYSTSSMLRTMELILGLKPMSQFDAAAIPMFNSFQAKPDLRPYTHRPVTVDLEERNGKTAWGSEASSKMDFSKEDAADDLLLNEVIWRAVRGADQPAPAPVRAAFVFPHSDDAGED
ncbi:MAG: bifunctional YncE family protein/alkaline phosphatase family protein [Verrucomicrobiia bacterium]